MLEPVFRAAPAALLVALTVIAGCRLEALQEIENEEASLAPLEPPPFIPAVDATTQPAVGWEAIVQQHLAFLAGPLAAGRRPGTDGARLTQRLAVATFSEAGLSPDGLDRTWTQPVPIEVVSNHRVRMTTELSNAEGESSSFSLDTGIYIRRDGLSATYRDTLQLVRLPPQALTAETLASEDLPDLPRGIAGSLVIAPLPGMELTSAADVIARGERIFEAARKQQAAGCLLALADGPLRSLIVERWSAPELRVRGSDGAPQTTAPLAFYGFIDTAVLDVLDAALESQAKVTVSIESQTRSVDDSNIIGRIPGDEDPGHVVMITAHWDAGALSPPLPKGGAAINNASGLASLFALAEISGRWFALGRRPRRSLVFVATAAGSLGHLGGAQVLTLPGLAPENIVAVINLESLDWRSQPLQAIDGGASSLGASLADFVPALETPTAQSRFGHTPFLQAGIPAVTLHRPESPSPVGPPEGWGSLEALAHDAEIAFRLAWLLAEGTRLPTLDHPPPSTVQQPPTLPPQDFGGESSTGEEQDEGGDDRPAPPAAQDDTPPPK